MDKHSISELDRTVEAASVKATKSDSVTDSVRVEGSDSLMELIMLADTDSPRVTQTS